MRRVSKRVLVLVIAVTAWVALRPSTATVQTPPPSREGLEFFEKKIRPVLTENCLGCHGAKAAKLRGNLMLDSREGMLRGGSSGSPAVTPGDPEKSLLLKAIRYTDAKLQMPPGAQLSREQILDFEAWIKMGAPDPRIEEPVATAPSYDFTRAKQFWSFQAVKNPAPPSVRDKTWTRNPIDQFILRKLEEKNIHPVADVDRRTLIRRATFDLTGLPPTPEEIDAFLADRSSNAFGKVIDRLLASPQYGEHWGRHWLDVVRYADTAGDNSDFPVPAAFRYRNYVIKSFNQDKPYDKFVSEQIAGDLLPSASQEDRNEKIIATGYLAMSRRFGSRNKEFNLTIDDTIDNVGKAFLGLSVSCARCHDHKFDPIPTRDYYALYGIFNSSRYAFPGAEIYPHPADMVALAPEKAAEAFYKWQKSISDVDDRKEQLVVEAGTAARNKAQKEKEAKEAAVGAPANNQSALEQDKAATGKTPNAIPLAADELQPADFDRDARNGVVARQSKRMPDEVEAEAKNLKALTAQLNESAPRVQKAYAVVDGRPSNVRVHRRGDPKTLGEEAPRGFLTVLGGQRLPDGSKGSGRDYLAGWIVDRANPLTARVMVNRIWGDHFGRGLVATLNDFGVRGEAPSHPELLDYLAMRLMEGGWSIKAMHRLIMSSHAYQLSSATSARNASVDVDNRLFWRFERRRLSAEEIRDSLLAVSGKLDRTEGQAHPFPQERDWRYSQHVQFFAVYDTNRRSVYLMQQRLKKHPLMEVFDGPDTNSSTARRSLTTTPVQALYLMNDPFVHQQADDFAARVGLAYEMTPGRIDFAYRLALGRPATTSELRMAAEYLKQIRAELVAAKVADERLTRAALASFLRVLLSSNAFLYVD
ncbi:MAG: PSD1 and planctomycete cytochrome C domain-containing protein [Acidobacteriota bacterium]